MIKSKNMILILAAVVLVGAIAYFATATHAPVKSGADASAVVAGANSAAASTGTVITDSELLSRWGPLYSVDNIPAEIKLPNTKNLYVTNFVIGDKTISGYIENKGTENEIAILKMTFINSQGYGVWDAEFLFTNIERSGSDYVNPGEKRYFELNSARTPAAPNGNGIKKDLSQVDAKFFKFDTK